jgi:hypothetical protein
VKIAKPSAFPRGLSGLVLILLPSYTSSSVRVLGTSTEYEDYIVQYVLRKLDLKASLGDPPTPEIGNSAATFVFIPTFPDMSQTRPVVLEAVMGDLFVTTHSQVEVPS